jgi:hypothetical protein
MKHFLETHLATNFIKMNNSSRGTAYRNFMNPMDPESNDVESSTDHYY